MDSQIGDNLKAIRRRNAYSQAELAEKAGLQKATIVRIETGRVQPRPRTLRKLAKALGVKPWELIEERRQTLK